MAFGNKSQPPTLVVQKAANGWSLPMKDGMCDLNQPHNHLMWHRLLVLVLAGVVLSASAPAGETNYPVRGVLKEIKPDEHQLVISHEAIPGFMEAMTMPFNVKDPVLLSG